MFKFRHCFFPRIGKGIDFFNSVIGVQARNASISQNTQVDMAIFQDRFIRNKKVFNFSDYQMCPANFYGDTFDKFHTKLQLAFPDKRCFEIE